MRAGKGAGKGHASEAHRLALTAAMDRYADGDAVAFRTVYDLLAPRLKAFFWRSMHDTSRTEDLVQQTLLQIHRARQTFAPGSDVYPWAFAIGRRLLIDAHRRKKCELVLDTTEEDSSPRDLQPSCDGCPDEIAIAREMAVLVAAELQRLPEPQRAAYELVRARGLPESAAAEALGTTTAAVKQRTYRAYVALRAALGMANPGRRDAK